MTMIDIDPSKFFIAISGVIIGFFLNVFEKVIGYRFVKRDDRKTIACILLYVLKDLEITDIHNNKVAFAVDRDYNLGLYEVNADIIIDRLDKCLQYLPEETNQVLNFFYICQKNYRYYLIGQRDDATPYGSWSSTKPFTELESRLQRICGMEF